MSISLLLNAPIKVKFIEGGESQSVLEVDPLAALAGNFYKDWTGTQGLLLELDASLEEEHILEADFSEHPIEDGSLVSDNYLERPRKLILKGTVTDSPVRYLSAITSGLGGVGAITGFTGVMPRRINAWNILKQIMKSGIPFDVATGLDLYKSVGIKRISSPQSAAIGRQLLFTADLEQKLILKKETLTPGNDLAATEEELGYLTSSVPDAVTVASAALFISLIAI